MRGGGEALAGRVALVTGGSSGIGAATADRLARDGARVVCADIAPPRAGAGHAHLPLDVTDEERWAAVVFEVERRYGAIDVLVTSAGVVRWGGVEECTLADFRTVQDVNVTGTFLGLKHVLPGMRSRGRGSVVTVSSVAGLIGKPNQVAYVASKWAVRGMTKAAARDMAGTGVRVNSVHPGPIRTPMTAGLSDEVFARQPMARRADPEEVAAMIAYLAGDGSSYCTGAEFVVDGGHVLG